MKPARPRNLPERIHWRGVVAVFDGLAPNTGDAFYKGTYDNGMEFHLVVGRLDAYQVQRRHMARGTLRTP